LLSKPAYYYWFYTSKGVLIKLENPSEKTTANESAAWILTLRIMLNKFIFEKIVGAEIKKS
jgi:hypothetical protein